MPIEGTPAVIVTGGGTGAGCAPPMADEGMDAFAAAAGLGNGEEAYATIAKDVPLRRPARPEEAFDHAGM